MILFFKPFRYTSMFKKTFLWIAAVSIIFSGCYPEPDSKDLFDELVVSTNYDPEADFGSYLTYAIPTDTIGLVSNQTQDTIITAQDGSDFPRPVLQAIHSAMDARGYTRVARNENPDLGINVVVVNDFNVFQQIVYPDPYYYPGSYYSGYYGYSSWYYYPYVNTYAYNTGVLIIELVDLKNKTPDNKVRVVWDAYLGDIYSTIELVNQTVDGIDQAFAQSPYIGKDL
jgi:hypothetical protein